MNNLHKFIKQNWFCYMGDISDIFESDTDTGQLFLSWSVAQGKTGQEKHDITFSFRLTEIFIKVVSHLTINVFHHFVTYCISIIIPKKTNILANPFCTQSPDIIRQLFHFIPGQ